MRRLALCISLRVSWAALATLGAAAAAGGGAPCASVSDCFGLGDCTDGACVCEPWASGSADCSVLLTRALPASDVAAWGYMNSSSPSWAGAFVQDVRGDGRWHGFVGAMTPGYPNRTSNFGAPEVVHLEQTGAGGGAAGAGEGGWRVAGAPIANVFQAQASPLPASQGGGFVLFSNAGAGSGLRGLMAAHVANASTFSGPGGGVPRMSNVYSPPWPSPAGAPWICGTNDWGAVVLPDGSVLGSFRNGGRHCANGSYPGWPAEQLGLVRASCWNCSDYRILTLREPLFAHQSGGASNEDAQLFWTHRGVHMVAHSQDHSDPSIPHQTRGVVAFSPSADDPGAWVISPRAAYGPSIELSNGSTLVARRRQRPGIVFGGQSTAGAAGAWPRRNATHISNCVDLVYSGNDDGWGDAWTMLQPLAQ